ncbi:Sugar kinase of the NBD/HSP70 family, may contain an N-terminal HTH domain [Amycolatopsis pretoriensis]|uniref:Sugar kinase of the NBD/HSP70 family, may contain an N-terminal HTH domain n=2 Tax=Amycolatopsis pretoriensis TaxID=218821 RepID=A0A1H5Q6K6_9PSEU|nr:ROK family protein [Amycolatopsis pretoriensis]SEF21041.1 Sugar kinase of the NBD/HSP70 family, may contain an N-terminal HTH domain [Amycolatopsis pretoriensis]
MLSTLGSRRRVCHHRAMTAVADGPQRTDGRGARRSAAASSVLRAVLDEGPIARSTIARRTGLSAAAVTGHTAELLRRGLLRELPETGKRGVGRPHVPVDLDTGRHVAGALHVAVHHATVALLDLRGNVLVQHEEPHDGLAAEDLLARAAEILDDLLLGHAPDREPLGLGVATGGWVDRASGTVVDHPLLGWRDVPVRDLLTASTGLTVAVDGHARSLVHAERLFGHPRARDSVVQLFTGNVVDSAFATGATVHHGPRSAAGAVAHLPVDDSAEPCRCGRTGCLEATVSEATLARKAGLPFPELLALAAHGDSEAVRMFHDRARLIGQAAALLLDVLNPAVLVVVDRSIAVVPSCLPAIRDEVGARSRRLDSAETVVGTSFPGTELATAGGAVLLDLLYEDPSYFTNSQN